MVGAVGRRGRAVVEERLVIAVPWVSLYREGIGGIRSAFMVPVNYLDVCENIRRVHLWIFGPPDVGHVAPVVRPSVKISKRILKGERYYNTV